MIKKHVGKFALPYEVEQDAYKTKHCERYNTGWVEYGKEEQKRLKKLEDDEKVLPQSTLKAPNGKYFAHPVCSVP